MDAVFYSPVVTRSRARTAVVTLIQYIISEDRSPFYFDWFTVVLPTAVPICLPMKRHSTDKVLYIPESTSWYNLSMVISLASIRLARQIHDDGSTSSKSILNLINQLDNYSRDCKPHKTRNAGSVQWLPVFIPIVKRLYVRFPFAVLLLGQVCADLPANWGRYKCFLRDNYGWE